MEINVNEIGYDKKLWSDYVIVTPADFFYLYYNIL